MTNFHYSEAFERNLGLISCEEQAVLRSSCVAIAGCGGVGGVHAHTFARLGVSKFTLADPDTYSVANFNRQITANVHTIDRNKAEATADLIKSINPEAEIRFFPVGVDEHNVHDFLDGADLVVDGIDFFSIAARRLLFQTASQMGIPAMTAAPLGFSGALLAFDSSGMSFDQYFDLSDEQSYYDQMINFIVGLAPSALHLPYMDLSGVDPKTGRGPSSVIGVQMAACLMGAQGIKILTGRKNVKFAPHYFQMDAYRLKSRSGYLNKGNKNWLQKIKRVLIERKFRQLGLDVAFKQSGGE